jgi:hypothetical protein
MDDKDGFADFLLAHQEVLVQTIDRTYVPLFDPAWDMPRWSPRLSQVRAPGVLPGQEGEGGLLSAWLYANLGWMDCPVNETLTATDREGELVASHAIQGILTGKDEVPDEPLAKDQALVELVESELSQNRGIGIYFAQVNRRD